MQRGLLAIFVGLLVMIVVWLVLMVVLFSIGSRVDPEQFSLPAPGETPQAPTDVRWLLATLAVDMLAAASGGLVVARIVGPGGRSQVTVAAIVLVIACLFQVFFDAGALPRWVPLARLVVAPGSLLLAARWWLGPPEQDSKQPDA